MCLEALPSSFGYLTRPPATPRVPGRTFFARPAQHVDEPRVGALLFNDGFHNLVAPLGGWPSLPPPNTPFRFCYASHLAVDDDNTQVFAALLRSLYNQAAGAGYDYFMIGLSEDNPLRAVVTRTYPRVTYTSQLYLVAWPDGAEAVGQVDGRVPGPEIAVM